ncbi:hypothetical protein Peur_015429 [Populus x canadensis]
MEPEGRDDSTSFFVLIPPEPHLHHKWVQAPLLNGKGGISMKDKPIVSGDYLVYVSTHENPGEPRTSWAAVYATELTTGVTRRLTPHGIADFSPAVSLSGVYTAVACRFLWREREDGAIKHIPPSRYNPIKISNTDTIIYTTKISSNKTLEVKKTSTTQYKHSKLRSPFLFAMPTKPI